MQVISNIHDEIAALRSENAAFKATNADFKTTIESLRQYILQLEEFIRHGRRKQFGASSEVVSDLQPSLFDEPENDSVDIAVDVEEDTADEATSISAPARKPRRALRIPPELPRVDIIHDLTDAQKICPHDGAALKHIDSEIHEQLDIVPARAQVLRHIRYTYACPCCAQHVMTAQKPKQPIEKGMASPRLLSTIATQKYVDGLPLYRQEQLFARMGLELDRTTQANWMMKCGALIQPLINLIHERMLEEPVLHMDETRVQVLNEPGKSPQSQSFMWVLKSLDQPAVLFHYAPTRSADIPKHLLADFSGALMVDGYEGYSAVCREQSIKRLGCWAHARRGFVDAKKAYGGRPGKADEALALIQALYRIEQNARDKPPEERLALRRKHSAPVIDTFKAWLDKHTVSIAPKSLLGKAVHYLNHQWPHLIRYLEDGRYPIDNNGAENAIRPFVIGRKNWLFSASQRGAESSANFYSLIETAKANTLEPHAYLTHVFTHLPNANTLDDIEALLPWAMKPLP